MSDYEIIEEALQPIKEVKVYHDWHDDGLKILDFILRNKPENQAAIAKLYADCPHKHSIDVRNGQRTPVTAHTVAAWAGNEAKNHTGIVARMKFKKLI